MQPNQPTSTNLTPQEPAVPPGLVPEEPIMPVPKLVPPVQLAVEPEPAVTESEPSVPLAASTGNGGTPVVSGGKTGAFGHRRRLLLAGAALGLLLVANSIGVVWLLTHAKPTVVQLGTNQNASNSANSLNKVLSLDIPTKSVGVGAMKPQGLQVGSSISTAARGTANVRVGLLAGSPTIVFENSKGVQWQLGLGDSGLQYGQVGGTLTALGTQTGQAANASPQANTTIGVNSSSTLAIQGTAVSIPNSLSIDSGTLYINSRTHQVGIGSSNTAGYKLYVAGTLLATSTITANGQILATSGSAGSPGYAFQGGESSGIFGNGSSVSISVGGGEVLRVQPGTITAVGANLQTDGYLRAGTTSANPAWKVERLTGTISSTDMDVPHGIGASNRILMVAAYYLDSGGNAQSVSGYFNNTYIHLTNGIVGRPYRITVMYSSDGAGW